MLNIADIRIVVHISAAALQTINVHNCSIIHVWMDHVHMCVSILLLFIRV